MIESEREDERYGERMRRWREREIEECEGKDEREIERENDERYRERMRV